MVIRVINLSADEELKIPGIPQSKLHTALEVGIIGAFLSLITWLHYRWANAPLSYHAVLQMLYYLPVAHSAAKHGLKGGVLAALAASAAYGIYFATDSGHDIIYDSMQVVLINMIGWVTGALAHSEKKIARQYLDISLKQEELIGELEERNAAVAAAKKNLEREVAERKALEEWLRRSEGLTAMGHLAAGVAHEIRNPLSIIRATMQILEEEQGSNPSVRECSGIIKEECDRMNAVIEEFLRFARPAPPKFEPVRLTDVIEDVLLLTTKFISRQGIGVVKEVPARLKPAWADPSQIKQVLINLIINSVEAMPQGGTLRLTLADKGKVREIRLKDSGIGIPPDLIAQIFGPFFSTKPKGTGLGLSIVGRIMENHKGTVKVESKQGEGTEFCLTLPGAGE